MSGAIPSEWSKLTPLKCDLVGNFCISSTNPPPSSCTLSPAQTACPSDSKNNTSALGLPVGAIVGITIGVLVLVASIIGFLLYKKKHKSSKPCTLSHESTFYEPTRHIVQIGLDRENTLSDVSDPCAQQVPQQPLVRPPLSTGHPVYNQNHPFQDARPRSTSPTKMVVDSRSSVHPIFTAQGIPDVQSQSGSSASGHLRTDSPASSNGLGNLFNLAYNFPVYGRLVDSRDDPSP